MRSVLSDEKKLSIAALSQTLPDRLIEQVTPMIGHQPLELLAGVLAAAVGVMQQRIGLAPPPDRHHQSVGDELRRHRGAHRPADDAPGEQVDDGGHIDIAERTGLAKSTVQRRLGSDDDERVVRRPSLLRGVPDVAIRPAFPASLRQCPMGQRLGSVPWDSGFERPRPNRR